MEAQGRSRLATPLQLPGMQCFAPMAVRTEQPARVRLPGDDSGVGPVLVDSQPALEPAVFVGVVDLEPLFVLGPAAAGALTAKHKDGL